ncbi:pyridoxal phosphate enzyme (YggS family) [Dysgonomonas sp. PFB1-18]|uniref:YggS family pyridoxal phosphate-dependent enzyme n=1 Tax=unclassified Dysgonomonas TaxID=2630389 RepID=UPI002474A09A|nr:MULTISPECIES: YggS family pyridoxal phosphate-dependent enzyme [unclassified Dysgonomonas]MDH6308883.1 pyridoxal phosphate enzyme (YggS family) [Dysgonomonas sp. PF1-14]MDH6338421.1 pyridoxal phosphate enzyme (YggS family) [Dysgonomonas sp. PF1-16]MDH6380132.1 pyridoxal phosphate enzyme (YggS family) [Dysgonomonas sp. PFB1-18]MDH6397249.1 pyridoxal phosphate enzyme (YggS family) [Dysgonomonas sp. PF1-23]
MSITDNIHTINKELPSGVKLVAVSKFHGADAIQEAYDAGQRIFGESRMQEIDQKHSTLPQDIEWHFIGHLQTNKVKYIVPYIHTIHSVDSWKLLSEIEKYASTVKKKVCCLLEVHIAQEESKYGLSIENCKKFLSDNLWKDCKYAYIGGLMGMATYTDDTEQIRKEFRALKKLFDEIKKDHFANDSKFSELSMGMSGDYRIAIEEGSTLIRIGSSIFGEREY